MAPRKYIKKMESAYERMFGEKPKQKYTSPLEKGDHPETDTTDLLDDKGINDYQSLIGMMQWAISLGRFDIHTAVMTMSSYTNAPRIRTPRSRTTDMWIPMQDEARHDTFPAWDTRLFWYDT
jgi:hypothetical protein